MNCSDIYIYICIYIYTHVYACMNIYAINISFKNTNELMFYDCLMIEKNIGKDVVTANKALIAQFLPEIQELLKANPSVKFCYEAAVCGGRSSGIHAYTNIYIYVYMYTNAFRVEIAFICTYTYNIFAVIYISKIIYTCKYTYIYIYIYIGIPVIHALHSDFLGDDITNVMGIMNGTTNFMLCKMEDDGNVYIYIYVYIYILE